MGWFENLFSQKGFNRKQFAGAILFVLVPYILQGPERLRKEIQSNSFK